MVATEIGGGDVMADEEEMTEQEKDIRKRYGPWPTKWMSIKVVEVHRPSRMEKIREALRRIFRRLPNH